LGKEEWNLTRTPSGVLQKLNVHILLVLSSMTCMFTDFCIPGLVGMLTMWPVVTPIYCLWTLSNLLLLWLAASMNNTLIIPILHWKVAGSFNVQCWG